MHCFITWHSLRCFWQTIHYGDKFRWWNWSSLVSLHQLWCCFVMSRERFSCDITFELLRLIYAGYKVDVKGRCICPRLPWRWYTWEVLDGLYGSSSLGVCGMLKLCRNFCSATQNSRIVPSITLCNLPYYLLTSLHPKGESAAATCNGKFTCLDGSLINFDRLFKGTSSRWEQKSLLFVPIRWSHSLRITIPFRLRLAVTWKAFIFLWFA